MNNTINQVTATSQIPAERQQQAKSDNGKFQSLLSDALNGKPQDTVKPVKAAEEPTQTESNTAKTKTESEAALETRTKPQTTEENNDDDEPVLYEQNAVIAAMQMQVLPQAPITVEVPQEQTATEVKAIETANSGQIQATSTTSATVLPIQTDFETAQAPDSIPTADAESAPTFTETASTANTAAQAIEQAETTSVNTPQAAETAGQQVPAAVRPRAEARRNTETAQTSARPEREAKDSEEIKTDVPDIQVVRQPQPLSHMQTGKHQVQTADTAQTRFDKMLARATQELNPDSETIPEQPSFQAESVEARIPEETPATEQTVNLEVKPEAAEQQDATATQAEPQKQAEQETQRPAEQKPQTTVLQSEKVPVGVQRPQKEASKTDEAVLGMVHPKTPVYTQETIRQEQAPMANPVQIPEQAEQVKAQLIRNLESEKMEFQMQLKPQELGKVDVKMILESGKLSIEIAAANPKSTEMLTRQAESLVASLKASGVDVSSVNVVTANENASADMNSEFNLGNFKNQANEQGQRAQGARHGREQNSGNDKKEQETRTSPQRILNYAV